MIKKPKSSYVVTLRNVVATTGTGEEVKIIPGTLARIIAYGKDHFRVKFASTLQFWDTRVMATVLRDEVLELEADLPFEVLRVIHSNI